VIDYDFEERLVDRIAAREAIAARLTPRQRHVLSRCYHYGETYREVAARDGVSATRINQIHDHAVRLLCKGFANQPKIATASPQQITRNTPPPGFDKVAFLRHMRWLIAKREEQAREQRARDEEEARNWRKREREALDRIMRNEEQDGLFDPPPPKPPAPPSWPSTPSLQIRLPGQYTVHPQQSYYVHNSPSYHPPSLPTLGDLNRIAHTALMYLFSARPQFDGTQTLGKWCTSVVFTRDGGEVSEAVNSIVRELPAHARLSAYPVPIEDGTLGAHATTPYASLRATVTPDGLKLRFDVTWD
jgi:hypothetical protein